MVRPAKLRSGPVLFQATEEDTPMRTPKTPALGRWLVVLLALALLAGLAPVGAAAAGTTQVAPFPGGKYSADGRVVAFGSGAADLVPGDTNGLWDLFLRDLATGAVTRVNVSSAGAEAREDDPDLQSYVGVSQFVLSADGGVVAFTTSASNLVAGDLPGTPDVFVRDVRAGTTTRVSYDIALWGEWLSLSADGRRVAFIAARPGHPNWDTLGEPVVRDLATGALLPVNVDSAGNPGNHQSWQGKISADGRYVAFASSATNLVPGDTNRRDDIFVRDLDAGVTTRVNVTSAGVQADHSSMQPDISADGRHVTFFSLAQNLAPGGGYGQLFVHDRQTGATTPIVVDPAGAQVDHRAEAPALLSGDGRFVAFASEASGLAPGDADGRPDVFVRDLAAGVTTQISVDSAGNNRPETSHLASFSCDGRYVEFYHQGPSLIPGGEGGAYLHDRGPLAAAPPACAAATWASPKASQAIAFAPLADRRAGDPPFAVSATASSGLPVAFAASGACAVAGTVVSLTGTGVCTVVATQPGDGAYQAARFVAQSFLVPHPAPQLGDLSPAALPAGPDGFTLTVAGAGFVEGSQVWWNGNSLPTTFASNSSLSVRVPEGYRGSPQTVEITVTNPAPGGGPSAPGALFITQVAATVTDTATGDSADPEGQAHASLGGAGASTPGSLSATATGSGRVTVAQYGANPVAAASPDGTTGYFDVYVARGSNFSALVVVNCTLGGDTPVHWWNGWAWERVSDQRFDAATGCVTLSLSADSSPALWQLTGTIFAGEAARGDTTPPAPPAIAFGLANGQAVPFGDVPAAPTCASSDAGSGLRACTVTGYQTTVGAHTLTATATDNAGNVATTTLAYTVRPWTTRGFHQPVDMRDPAGKLIVNSVKAGATVPLKFEAFKGAGELRDISAVKGLTYRKADVPPGTPADEIEVVASGDTGLRFDAPGDQFIFNWKTPAAGTYLVTVTLWDGTTIEALFRTR
jgi:Tol biopolymer transport system component